MVWGGEVGKKFLSNRFAYVVARETMQLKRLGSGFSLIELMIVVAIIGILAAIAYPSYQRYVENTRRSVAQAELMELAQWMERRYTASYTYLDGANPPSLPFQESPRDGGATFYNLSFQGNVTRNAFTLQAVPAGAQDGDRCGTLTLTSAGVRGAAEGDCW